jgi:hypothetical protein
MKKVNYLFVACAFLLLAPFISFGQTIVFSEDFDGVNTAATGGDQYGFPSNWTRINVDGGTPFSTLITSAWVRREDINNYPDSVAVSTSYMTPSGIADDWMWTPPIAIPTGSASTLTWNAQALSSGYADGYSVRVMLAPNTPNGTTGNLGNMVTNSVEIFTIPAENSIWTSRSVSLGAYAGQTIQIAYRNNSNDKYILYIDDITITQPIENDIKLLSTLRASEYTIMPETQASPLLLQSSIQNIGVLNATNVFLRATVLKMEFKYTKQIALY